MKARRCSWLSKVWLVGWLVDEYDHIGSQWEAMEKMEANVHVDICIAHFCKTANHCFKIGGFGEPLLYCQYGSTTGVFLIHTIPQMGFNSTQTWKCPYHAFDGGDDSGTQSIVHWIFSTLPVDQALGSLWKYFSTYLSGFRNSFRSASNPSTSLMMILWSICFFLTAIYWWLVWQIQLPD